MAVTRGTEVTWEQMKALEDLNNSKAGLPPIHFLGKVRTFSAPTNDPLVVAPVLAELGHVGTRNVMVDINGVRTFAAAAPMRPGDIAVNIEPATAIPPYHQYKAWRLDRHPQTDFSNWTELTNLWCYEQLVGAPESNRWAIGDGLYIVRPPGRGLYTARTLSGTQKQAEAYRGWLTEINRTRAEIYRRYYLKTIAPRETDNLEQTMHVSGPWFTPFGSSPGSGFRSLSGDAPPSRKYSGVSFWIPEIPEGATTPQIQIRHDLQICFKQVDGVWVTGWDQIGAVAPPDGSQWRVDLITMLGQTIPIADNPYVSARPGRDFDVITTPPYESLRRTILGTSVFVHVRLNLTGYNGPVRAQMGFSNVPIQDDGKLDTPWRWAASHGHVPNFGLDFIPSESGIRFHTTLTPGNAPPTETPSGISGENGGGWTVINGEDHTRFFQLRMPDSQVYRTAGQGAPMNQEIYQGVAPGAALSSILYATNQTVNGLATVHTFPPVDPPTDEHLSAFAPQAFASAPLDESDPRRVRSSLFRGHYLWPVRPLDSATAAVQVGGGTVLVVWAIAASRRPRADGTFDLSSSVTVRIGSKSPSGTLNTVLATIEIPAGRQGVVKRMHAPLFRVFAKTLHYSPADFHVQVLALDELEVTRWFGASNAPDKVYRVTDGWPNTRDPYSQDGALGAPTSEVRARGGYAFAYQYNDTLDLLELES
ncbi:MAG TPA: hypothetical protein VNO50_10985 [Pyrinomonadaceae bacterium]|nr:hypothetical protein [Pyrinomonadaceae bacterium]